MGSYHLSSFSPPNKKWEKIRNYRLINSLKSIYHSWKRKVEVLLPSVHYKFWHGRTELTQPYFENPVNCQKTLLRIGSDFSLMSADGHFPLMLVLHLTQFFIYFYSHIKKAHNTFKLSSLGSDVEWLSTWLHLNASNLGGFWFGQLLQNLLESDSKESYTGTPEGM